ncbi:MAG: ADP-forming succinate--CoA ligase subunit beta [Parachlamydiaceae bacterium]
MDIHEYQAKEILRQYGISTPDFGVISSSAEVLKVADALHLESAILKVQVHAGGRGKAGGVKIARNRKEMVEVADQLLGLKIINNQTGSKGITARQVLVTALIDVKREFYVGAVIDRKRAQATLIVSTEGGMDIEEVAAKHPHKILTVPLTENGSIRGYNLIRIVNFLGWTGSLAEQGKKIVQGIARAFVEKDASLIEINPLVETVQGDLIALDAKFSIDDNALYRHPEIAAFYDPSQITSEEVHARVNDLAYVALEGNIGCMVNGAGLAMATMDIIHLCGGAPANFLDVGGGASREKVAAGFKIILSDPKVKAILVNIFGGIMNCETLAAGIVAAAGELQMTLPLVVRMEGTNVEQGRRTLQESGLKIIIAPTLTEAAERVVAEAKKRN